MAGSEIRMFQKYRLIYTPLYARSMTRAPRTAVAAEAGDYYYLLVITIIYYNIVVIYYRKV